MAGARVKEHVPRIQVNVMVCVRRVLEKRKAHRNIEARIGKSQSPQGIAGSEDQSGGSCHL